MLIDSKCFSHPANLEIMARHVQTFKMLLQAKELAPFFEPDPKRNHRDYFNISSLEGAKRYVRDTALTTYHTCGAAAILPREKGVVVNEKLIMYSTKNLRTLDASIFPLILRGLHSIPILWLRKWKKSLRELNHKAICSLENRTA